MGRVGVLVEKRVAASTLVEVLVAMVLVMLAFGLGLGLYVSVIQSSYSQQRSRAKLLAENALIEMELTGDYSSEVIENNAFKIELEVNKSINEAQNLVEVHVVAKTNNDKLLFQMDRYMLVNKQIKNEN